MAYRNIAIIAHVDHGKTTLVDAMLKQSGTFRENENIEVRVMDSDDQEKERGITIYAKNTSINYKGDKLNIIDTPGHADFGSEVERGLRMVDSVLLLVDAYEGPMPQTKFVLKKSLELGLKPIVVINKIDKPSSRPEEVVDMVFDLFASLGANDEQLDFPVVYAIARDGIAKNDPDDDSTDLEPLFSMILDKVEEAESDTDADFVMQVANLGYDNFLGRLAIGRVYAGKAKVGQQVTIVGNDGVKRKGKISKLLTTMGLNNIEIDEIEAGDIVTLAGIPDIFVGETIGSSEEVEQLPLFTIDKPTLKMEFLVNDSPFAGKEGKFLTTRHIKDRLERELETNVGLAYEDKGDSSYLVSGRGELHLSVLIETMRREGFELQVSAPEVIFEEKDGVKYEPIEKAIISVPEEFGGAIIEKMGTRKGEMVNMQTENGTTIFEFMVPTRGLLGFRNEFITITKGEGILSSGFEKFEPFRGNIEKRSVGSLISGETGKTMAYSLWKLQERGPLFIGAATEVYEGMIIGEHLKGTDLTVNPCKNKQLTNVRSSGADEALKLTTTRKMTLEDALDYIAKNEYVEITPDNIRLRKKYLKEGERKRFDK